MEIFRGRRLWIEERKVQLPNGLVRDKVIVHPSNAVAVLPLEGDRCKLLRQYRYAINDYLRGSRRYTRKG
jgi:ADP-ribose pyrophosphatase